MFDNIEYVIKVKKTRFPDYISRCFYPVFIVFGWIKRNGEDLMNTYWSTHSYHKDDIENMENLIKNKLTEMTD